FVVGSYFLSADFLTNFWHLFILRFLVGIAIGGLIPVRLAYIRQEAPLSMQGEVIGYNTSLRFLGNIVGPALGGLLASFYGFGSVFIVTSALLIVAGFIMLVVANKYEFVSKTKSQHVQPGKH